MVMFTKYITIFCKSVMESGWHTKLNSEKGKSTRISNSFIGEVFLFSVLKTMCKGKAITLWKYYAFTRPMFLPVFTLLVVDIWNTLPLSDYPRPFYSSPLCSCGSRLQCSVRQKIFSSLWSLVPSPQALCSGGSWY